MSTECTYKGSQTRYCVADLAGAAAWSAGAGTNAHRFFPNSFGMTFARQQNVLARMTGRLAPVAADVQQELWRFGGGVSIEPTFAEWKWWLKRITGTAASPFELVASLPPFAISAAVGNVFSRYNDCYVAKASISGKSGAPLMLQLDIMAKDRVSLLEATFTTNYGLGVTTLAGPPLYFSTGSFELDAATYPFSEFELTIDHKLAPLYYSSTKPQCIDRTDVRGTTLKIGTAFSSQTSALVGAGGASAAALLEFVEPVSGDSMVISAPAIVFPSEMPPVQGRGPIDYAFTAACTADASGSEVSFTITE